MQRMLRGNGVECTRSGGIEYLSFMPDGVLLFIFGRVRVRDMRRREFRGCCGGVNLRGVRFRPIRFVDGIIGLCCLLRRHLFK